MKAMEGAASESSLNRSLPDAQPIELPSPDDAVLPIGEVSNPAVDPTRRVPAVHRSRLSTKSAFGTHTVLNALLVVPCTDGLVRDRTCGARFAPKASTGAQKRPQPAVAASGFDPFK
jgi:hypothetical protein